ncbi:MAG: hypothetical protein ACJ77Z_00190 [Thermoleophilaceae bacterium]
MIRRVLITLALAAAVFPALVHAADPPTTTITAGPNGNSLEKAPQFEFTSDVPGSFECSLDSAAFAPCTSPHKAGPLPLGFHTFSVRALDADGQPDAAPPVRAWTLVAPIDTPVVKLSSPTRRTVAVKKLVRLSGTAKAPAGVSRIQVTLQRGGPDKNFFPPRCTYFDLHTGTKYLQPCLLPAYFAAKGTTRWHYTVAAAGRRVLTPGKYTLVVRAFNPYGEATQQRFPLTLR